MPLNDASWTEHLIPANGIRQHIWRTGSDKPPVLCLPGFSEIGLTWSRVARELADRFDVIMVDFRGQGRTEVGRDTYSQDTLTRDVAGLIEALDLDDVMVMGFSNGGGVAAQLGAEYPDLVRRLILEDPGWGPKPSGQKMAESPQYRAWFDSHIAWLAAFQQLTTEEQEAQITAKLPPGGGSWDRKEIRAFATSMAQYDLDFAKRGMALWSVTDKPVRDLIQHVRAPTLLMVATAGGMPGAPSPLTDIHDTVAALPHVTLLEFETSHFIRRDAFERFVEAVLAFA